MLFYRSTVTDSIWWYLHHSHSDHICSTFTFIAVPHSILRPVVITIPLFYGIIPWYICWYSFIPHCSVDITLYSMTLDWLLFYSTIYRLFPFTIPSMMTRWYWLLLTVVIDTVFIHSRYSFIPDGPYIQSFDSFWHSHWPFDTIPVDDRICCFHSTIHVVHVYWVQSVPLGRSTTTLRSADLDRCSSLPFVLILRCHFTTTDATWATTTCVTCRFTIPFVFYHYGPIPLHLPIRYHRYGDTYHRYTTCHYRFTFTTCTVVLHTCVRYLVPSLIVTLITHHCYRYDSTPPAIDAICYVVLPITIPAATVRLWCVLGTGRYWYRSVRCYTTTYHHRSGCAPPRFHTPPLLPPFTTIPYTPFPHHHHCRSTMPHHLRAVVLPVITITVPHRRFDTVRSRLPRWYRWVRYELRSTYRFHPRCLLFPACWVPLMPFGGATVCSATHCHVLPLHHSFYYVWSIPIRYHFVTMIPIDSTTATTLMRYHLPLGYLDSFYRYHTAPTTTYHRYVLHSLTATTIPLTIGHHHHHSIRPITVRYRRRSVPAVDLILFYRSVPTVYHSTWVGVGVGLPPISTTFLFVLDPLILHHSTTIDYRPLPTYLPITTRPFPDLHWVFPHFLLIPFYRYISLFVVLIIHSVLPSIWFIRWSTIPDIPLFIRRWLLIRWVFDRYVSGHSFTLVPPIYILPHLFILTLHSIHSWYLLIQLFVVLFWYWRYDLPTDLCCSTWFGGISMIPFCWWWRY